MTASDAAEYEMRRDAALVPRGGAQRHPDPVTHDEINPPPHHHDDDPDHVVGQLPKEWRTTAP